VLDEQNEESPEKVVPAEMEAMAVHTPVDPDPDTKQSPLAQIIESSTESVYGKQFPPLAILAVHTPSPLDVWLAEQKYPLAHVMESEHEAPEAKATHDPDTHCEDKQALSEEQLCPGSPIGNWHFPLVQGNPPQSDVVEHEDEGVRN